jgi:DNA-binding transcriptional LysR family regulator
VVDETEQAASSVGESLAEPRGEIRLAAPMSFGQRQIAPRLPGFLARFPQVRLHVELTDRMVDLVSERFDLAVRITNRLTDTSFVQRRLCPIRFIACAAPSYLAAHGTPRGIEDLAQHNCLNPAGAPWRGILRGHLAPGRRLRLEGNLAVDSADGVHRVALLGHGIACLPTFVAGDDLRAGRLVPVLPRQLSMVVSAFALHPQSRHPRALVRSLIDHLADAFGPKPAWDTRRHEPPGNA